MRRKLNLVLSVNWIKTIIFNFKKFPFSVAIKLPVFFYGKVKFSSIEGEVKIEAPIETGMIGFGQQFEFPTTYKGTAEILLAGTWVFKGNAQLGKDCVINIAKGAYCEFGFMACLGSSVKLICKEKIVLGEWTGVGYESQLIDTNSHPMKNSETGEYYPLTAPIIIGSHNAFSNRISVMPGTKTPNFCVVASNSLLNKDYRALGNNILIGGLPAKLLKNNYTRDWEGEKELLKKYKIFKW